MSDTQDESKENSRTLAADRIGTSELTAAIVLDVHNSSVLNSNKFVSDSEEDEDG